jgi:type 1 glutamine amidotransferase
MIENKSALVVRGGWDGHQPFEATELFIPYLKSNGYDVRIEESPKVYADAAYMAGVDLVMQCMTMTTIERDEFEDCGPPSRTARAWPAGTAESRIPTATTPTTCT